jgi:hypothetical protein
MSMAEYVRQKRWKKDSIYVPSLFKKDSTVFRLCLTNPPHHICLFPEAAQNAVGGSTQVLLFLILRFRIKKLFFISFETLVNPIILFDQGYCVKMFL